uniref:Uncharacterized protein n=1 Tax=Anguilla anguilla TaxID=7936 RepID=A0A0E9X296_ANGAN
MLNSETEFKYAIFATRFSYLTSTKTTKRETCPNYIFTAPFLNQIHKTQSIFKNGNKKKKEKKQKEKEDSYLYILAHIFTTLSITAVCVTRVAYTKD